MSYNFNDLKTSISAHRSIWLLAAVYVGGFLYLGIWSHWNGVTFIPVDEKNIVGYLTPLILTAALIERAVEVAITPWRDPDADDKASKVKVASDSVKANVTDDQAKQELADSKNDLNQYRGKTRQYAYAVAVALSAVAVTAGVRALWPLLQPDNVTHQVTFPGGDPQANFFCRYDMVLTTLLLAGGAAGLHAPINGFTSFFEKKNP